MWPCPAKIRQRKEGITYLSNGCRLVNLSHLFSVLWRAVHGTASDDPDPAVIGELENDVVVNYVKCAIERADGQLGRPVKLDLVDWHRGVGTI